MSNKVEVATVKPEISFSYGEESLRILEFLEESLLDSKIESIVNYMKETNGLGKTDEQKDSDYAHAQSLWREYQKELRTIKFNFYLDNIDEAKKNVEKAIKAYPEIYDNFNTRSLIQVNLNS